MLFLGPAPTGAVFVESGFGLTAFFRAVAARSDGSDPPACEAVESGVGEVSSGKVMLHNLSLETT
jgi:hypothetical protein